jgi:hypothetical protein
LCSEFSSLPVITYDIALPFSNSVFGDVTPCSPVEDHTCFGGTYRLHLQDLRVSQVNILQESSIAGYFFDLLFNPEDRGSMFLGNVG